MNTAVQDEVIEMIHGVEVRDPNRWLEERALPRTDEWINKQKRICQGYFSLSKSYRALGKIVSDALAAEIIDQAIRVGSRVFLRKQSVGQAQAAIWVRFDEESESRLLVDPAMLGSDIAIEILQISSDGKLLAYSVRDTGSDEMRVRIADIESGEMLPDHLPPAYLRGFYFDALGKGFFYCLEPRLGTADLAIRYHRIGCASNDEILFTVPQATNRRLVLLSCENFLGALVTEGAGADAIQDLYLAPNGGVSWNIVYRQLRGRRWPLLAHGSLFLLDMEDKQNGRLVGLSDTGDSLRIVVPECHSPIQKCLAVSGGFLVSYLVDRHLRMERWSTEGELIGPLNLPSGGSIDLISPCTELSSSVFFLHESYTEAPSLWEIKLTEQCLTNQWTAPKERFTATTREYWYTSFDGTRVPIVLLEPVVKHSEGPCPVVLFGYGGFGFAELPRYSRLAKVLLKLGVTVARAAIRGGSDFGEDWHIAGIRRNKQRSIDDFLAAAHWLFAKGLTDHEHLAIMGGSNGGLLVAAAATQKPELFKAGVCTGPLTDMIRYELFDRASRWRSEYGTVEDPEDFKALLAYSPYHNIKLGVEYPAMLFVTGDADDRCNPAHVRKMLKSLQDLPSQQAPFIVDYGQAWGHVPTLSLAERVDGITRKVAFICDQLNIALPVGGADELAGV